MKITSLPCLVLLAALTACSTVKHHSSRALTPKRDSPEPVIVTYYAKAGAEEDLQDLLARAWTVYQKEHLVFAKPHVVARQKERDGQTRFVEIFTWVSHAAPASAPASVTALWQQMTPLCEPRHGYEGLDGGEIQLLSSDGQSAKR